MNSYSKDLNNDDTLEPAEEEEGGGATRKRARSEEALMPMPPIRMGRDDCIQPASSSFTLQIKLLHNSNFFSINLPLHSITIIPLEMKMKYSDKVNMFKYIY